MKPILCLDFDGVCNSYASGWCGMTSIPDPPVSGLFEFIIDATEHFYVQVFSSRSMSADGITAMGDWFHHYYSIWQLNDATDEYFERSADRIQDLVSFPDHKPPAAISIDDRAITFTGTWPAMEMLKGFKPWTKGHDDLSEYVSMLDK